MVRSHQLTQLATAPLILFTHRVFRTQQTPLNPSCLPRLVRETLYPSLRDHPSVEGYPPVAGLVQPLFFLDHAAPEAGQDEGRSKSNEWEAQFAVGLARSVPRKEWG